MKERLLELSSSIASLWRCARSALGLFYATLKYCSAFISDEDYYFTKGNTWCDFGLYRWALKAFQKALQERESAHTHASMGWCYSQMDMPDAALASYRKAYALCKTPDILMGLAVIEFHTGNIQRSRELLMELDEESLQEYPQFALGLERLTSAIKNAESSLSRASE